MNLAHSGYFVRLVGALRHPARASTAIAALSQGCAPIKQIADQSVEGTGARRFLSLRKALSAQPYPFTPSRTSAHRSIVLSFV